MNILHILLLNFSSVKVWDPNLDTLCKWGYKFSTSKQLLSSISYRKKKKRTPLFSWYVSLISWYISSFRLICGLLYPDVSPVFSLYVVSYILMYRLCSLDMWPFISWYTSSFLSVRSLLYPNVPTLFYCYVVSLTSWCTSPDTRPLLSWLTASLLLMVVWCTSCLLMVYDISSPDMRPLFKYVVVCVMWNVLNVHLRIVPGYYGRCSYLESEHVITSSWINAERTRRI